jgi:hypothetical protein
MTHAQQLSEITNQLRELQRTSPTSMADLAAWDTSARLFTQQLSSQHPELQLPAQVMHYLHDADIRVKDPEYRLAQDKIINGIITDIEQGSIPLSMETNMSFHPRWLAAAALLLLTLLYWVVFQ